MSGGSPLRCSSLPVGGERRRMGTYTHSRADRTSRDSQCAQAEMRTGNPSPAGDGKS
jgi:hypothetical protein